MFRKLEKADIEKIADKMLEDLSKRLEGLSIRLECDGSVSSLLAERGFDPVYGARPLRREIQNDIEDPLSEKILDGSIKNGDTVKCTVKDGKFEFTR